ncbi:NXPE family member 3-like isoform X2 [Xyrichtys novacula]|uniref:NXPE family member 3-like isoform X2 n=1 Tax=Xyrichtys novacula TaxID=13765 RepID=A0AAV1F085_XYRNO|nr:NXPE family member 3-like isoform X2 [Xyrichtys novacula]
MYAVIEVVKDNLEGAQAVQKRLYDCRVDEKQFSPGDPRKTNHEATRLNKTESQQDSSEELYTQFLSGCGCFYSSKHGASEDPLSLEQTSDPGHSTFTILPGEGEWHVGDQLKVLIKIKDLQGHAKTFGGDVLVAWLHSRTLSAGVAGKVEDHLNGSYSAVYPLLWEGSAQVEVKLIMVFLPEVMLKAHLQSQATVIGGTGKSEHSGYYYQGVWRALGGSRVQQFNTSSAISQCLKGKMVHLYGDSTIRQWFEFLDVSLPDAQHFDLKGSKQAGPHMILDHENHFMITYRCHGPPLRFTSIPISQLRYIANELDGLKGGSDTVVVIGIWAHFSTFPIEVYLRRLQSIRRAVVHLLNRAPGTLVIIRTSNLKALTLYETLTNSDWFTIQRDKVLRAIFKGVNVKLVDAWEMVLAHHLPHSLHPQPPIIKNMIDVLLSYACPKK